MAENTPNPAGESGKIQPKKETVRINLPPKPTAAPTVRLPAPAAASGGVAAPKAAAPAPAGGKAPAAAPSKPAGAPPSAPPKASAGPAPGSRPSAPPRRSMPAAGVSGLDIGLSVAAAVIGAATLIHVLLLSAPN